MIFTTMKFIANSKGSNVAFGKLEHFLHIREIPASILGS